MIFLYGTLYTLYWIIVGAAVWSHLYKKIRWSNAVTYQCPVCHFNARSDDEVIIAQVADLHEDTYGHHQEERNR